MPSNEVLNADFEALAACVKDLEDERDIRRALERYGHSIDYGMEAEWVDFFTEDGVDNHIISDPPKDWTEMFPMGEFSPEGMKIRGRRNLAAFISLHSRIPDVFHKHIVLDTVITRSSQGGRAAAVSYFLRIDDVEGRREVTVFGRYIDTLVRGMDGRWRFQERKTEIESMHREMAHTTWHDRT